MSGALLRNLLLFGRVLRSLGLDVNAGRMLDLVAALPLISIGRRSDFYYAARGVIEIRAPANGDERKRRDEIEHPSGIDVESEAAQHAAEEQEIAEEGATHTPARMRPSIVVTTSPLIFCTSS